ncbi:hypothetical protein RFI_31010, partial [Reticulomyxa filosa]
KRFGYYYKDLKYDTVLRWEILSSIPSGIFDWIALLCGIMSVVIMPFRLMAFCRCFYIHWDSYKNDKYNVLREALMMNLVFGICDWLFVICTIPLLIMLTRYYHIAKLIQQNWQRKDMSQNVKRAWSGKSEEGEDEDENGNEKEREEKYQSYNDYLKYNTQLRWDILSNLGPGLMDWFALVAGVAAAILCPFTRLIPLVRSFGAFKEDYVMDNYNNWRFGCFISLGLVVVDWIAIVTGLIALCSLIRTPWVIRDLYTCMDKNDAFGNFQSPTNWALRFSMYRNFVFIFTDLLFLAMFLICLGSVYRAIESVYLISDTKEWTEQRMNAIRWSIFSNFLNFLATALLADTEDETSISNEIKIDLDVAVVPSVDTTPLIAGALRRPASFDILATNETTFCFDFVSLFVSSLKKIK